MSTVFVSTKNVKLLTEVFSTKHAKPSEIKVSLVSNQPANYACRQLHWSDTHNWHILSVVTIFSNYM